MLVYVSNGPAAMLVYPTNPTVIELYYHANAFFCTDHVSKNTLLDVVNTWMGDQIRQYQMSRRAMTKRRKTGIERTSLILHYC